MIDRELMAARFWPKVDRSAGPKGCWPYKPNPSQRRGKFSWQGKPYIPCRVAYYLTHETWPDPMCLHSCDVERCCNPDHLRAGTTQENSDDMVSRGRSLSQKGDRNHSSKLSWRQVREIRQARSAGVKGKDLAISYGVSQATISEIVNFRHWE